MIFLRRWEGAWVQRKATLNAVAIVYLQQCMWYSSYKFTLPRKHNHVIMYSFLLSILHGHVWMRITLTLFSVILSHAVWWSALFSPILPQGRAAEQAPVGPVHPDVYPIIFKWWHCLDASSWEGWQVWLFLGLQYWTMSTFLSFLTQEQACGPNTQKLNLLYSSRKGTSLPG